MWSWVVVYLLVRIDIILDRVILLVLGLLVSILVLGGIFGLTFGVDHDFLLISHRRCQMMLSRIDNNFELQSLMNELENSHLQIPEKGQRGLGSFLRKVTLMHKSEI